MSRKGLFITAACVLAALLLAATLVFGPERGTRSKGISITPSSQPASGLGDTSVDARLRPANSTGQYTYTSINRAGQLVEVYGDWILPKPQGVLEVGWPGMRIHLTPTRVLEVRSEHGTFIAPDNKPRQGEFDGPVVLTLFESATGREPVLTNDSPDARLRVFMTDANFDLELGRLESAKKVHLTSPRVDFEGVGLSLSYSEMRGRMERLVVSRGSVMRLSPEPQSPPGSTTQRHDATTRPDSKRDPRITYYRAQVSEEVDARSPELNALADQATILMAFGPGAGRDRSLKTMDRSQPHSTIDERSAAAAGFDDEPSWPIFAPVFSAMERAWQTFFAPESAHAAAAGPATKPMTLLPLPIDRPMTPPAVGDTVIRWKGQLTIVPLEQAPAELATPEDIHLVMTGQPVRVTTPRKESIRGASLEYATAQGTLSVIGDKQNPMVVESAQVGTLEGERLFINQMTGIGRVEGAGRLRAVSGIGAAAAAEAGMTVTWSERLDLTFFTEEAPTAPGAKRTTPRLRGIRDTVFRGRVHVMDPRFELVSDLLVTRLSDPAQGKVSMQNVQAIGKARLVGKGEGGKKELDLQSNTIQIDATSDSKGRTIPLRLIAEGQVDALLPDRHMTCGHLDVELTSDSGNAGVTVKSVKGAATRESQRVALRLLTATKNVRVRAEAEKVEIEADRMLADGRSEYLELFGTPEKPAILRRPDATIIGPHMTLRQTDQTIDVQGAGLFEFDSAAPAAGKSTPRANAKPTRVAVSWSKSMHADNRKGSASFVGAVEAKSRQEHDTTLLTAPELLLAFEPSSDPKKSDAAEKSSSIGKSTKAPSAVPIGQVSQSLRTVTTKGSTSFVAERWAGEPGGELVSRLTLRGPGLLFDNVTERVTVEGKGEMLVEDYRPAQAAAGQPAGEDPMIHMTGRGKTYFTWVDRMMLDAKSSTLAMDGQVQMLHKPAPKGDSVQLDCQVFRATTTGRSGLGAWMGGDQPQASLKSMTAEKNVQVLVNTKVIKSDRLEYTGEDQTVRLTCDPGRVVEVSDTATGTTRTAEELWLDLARDRVTIERPGPVRVPLNR